MKLRRSLLALALALVPVAATSNRVAAAPVAIDVQPANVPGILTGSVSDDGRYALVQTGSDMHLSDSTTGTSPVVGHSVGGGGIAPSFPQVLRISGDGGFLLELVAGATTGSYNLVVMNRSTSALRTVASDVGPLLGATISSDGSIVGWVDNSGGVEHAWVGATRASAVDVAAGLAQDAWPILGTGPTLSGHFGQLTVSGDGTSAVFSHANPTQPGCAFPAVDCLTRLAKYDLASGSRAFVNLDPAGGATTGSFLSIRGYATDGSAVLWSQTNIGGGANRVYLRRLAAGNTTILAPSESVGVDSMAMSGDAQKVLALVAAPESTGLNPVWLARIYDTSDGSFMTIPKPVGDGWNSAFGTAFNADGTKAWLVTGLGVQGYVATIGSATPPSFTALTPGRLLDTRLKAETVDGQAAGTGIQRADTTLKLKITTRHGVPTKASAAALNVTATGTQAAGFLTVWPCNDEKPNASNLNYGTDATIANTVITKIGTDGDICIYTSATTHLIADITGYYPTGSTFTALTPGRLLDTRLKAETVDGQAAGTGIQRADTTLKLKITTRHGVPTNATAATLNVTATGTQGAGFLTIWPCNGNQPNSSNLNYDTDTTIANTVITKIGTDGEICIYTSAATHLITDITGYYPTGSSFTAITPVRLLDSRPDGDTVDGDFADIGPAPIDGVLELDVGGRGSVPVDAAVAVLNITVTDARDGGFLTLWPCDEPQPNSSSLNFDIGDTIANAAITKLSASGTVCIYASAETHVIADVTGFYPAA
jgi:hypothetical protein